MPQSVYGKVGGREREMGSVLVEETNRHASSSRSSATTHSARNIVVMFVYISLVFVVGSVVVACFFLCVRQENLECVCSIVES